MLARSAVDDPVPAYHRARELTEPVLVSGYSYDGLNPTSSANAGYFHRVFNDANVLRNFCIANIRIYCTGDGED
jgi:hypothetical protein